MNDVTTLDLLRIGDRFVFWNEEAKEDAGVVYPDGPFEVDDEGLPRRNHPGHVLVPVRTATGRPAVYDLPATTSVRKVPNEL